MLALSIRQPFADVVPRGTAEYRMRARLIVGGQRFHIYASKPPVKNIWSRGLAMHAGDVCRRG